MAKERAFFINREKELEEINNAILDADTQKILLVIAQGGIGKTRLIQEVYHRNQELPVHFANVVDFADATFHNEFSILDTISDSFSDKFNEYFQVVRSIQEARSKDMNINAIDRLENDAVDVFVHSFNQVSKDRRVIFAFDTTDALSNFNPLEKLVPILSQLKNYLLLVAGRNAEYFENFFNNIAQIEPVEMYLEPLDEKAGKEYLEEKIKDVGITLKKEMADKIVVLSQGKPILLDLAIEWLARDIPMDWLIEMSPDEIENMSVRERENKIRDFEKRLVNRIVDVRYQIDIFSLLLSRFYPLDRYATSQLMEIPSEEVDSLFVTAADYVFIKDIPDGKLSLHDEMRRMIHEHVWKKIDPNCERRIRDSKKIINFLKNEIEILEKKLGDATTHNINDLYETTAEFSLQRQIWVYKQWLLEHTLFVEEADGIELFKKLFDEATKKYVWDNRREFLRITEKVIGGDLAAQPFEYKTRHATSLIDDGEVEKAETILHSLLENKDLSNEQKADIYMKLGDVENQLAKFSQAIENFTIAKTIYESENNEGRLVITEKALGYSNRLLGDWKAAADHYRAALKSVLRLGIKDQQVYILNNLAFVTSYQRKKSEGIQLNDQALIISQELNSPRLLGASLSTRGTILYIFSEYEESIRILNQAEEIFGAQNDVNFLSTIYAWRGASYMSLALSHEGELAQRTREKSRNDFLKGRDLGIERDQPMILSRLARITLDMGLFNEALPIAKECYQISKEANNHVYEMASIETIAYLSLLNKDFQILDKVEEMKNDYLNRVSFPRWIMIGRYYCSAGGLALGLNRKMDAIEYYKKGFKLMAEAGMFGDMSLTRRLLEVEKTASEIGNAEFMKLMGEEIEKYWDTEKLDESNPEALPVFSKWKNWK